MFAIISVFIVKYYVLGGLSTILGQLNVLAALETEVNIFLGRKIKNIHPKMVILIEKYRFGKILATQLTKS